MISPYLGIWLHSYPPSCHRSGTPGACAKVIAYAWPLIKLLSLLHFRTHLSTLLSFLVSAFGPDFAHFCLCTGIRGFLLPGNIAWVLLLSILAFWHPA